MTNTQRKVHDILDYIRQSAEEIQTELEDQAETANIDWEFEITDMRNALTLLNHLTQNWR